MLFISMCSGEDYAKWTNEDTLYDIFNDVFICSDEIEEYKNRHNHYKLVDRTFFSDLEVEYGFEIFSRGYVTKSGEEIVTFGYYGRVSKELVDDYYGK